MVLAREAVWRAWTEVRWGREHGRRLLGAADALAPTRGVALAAVPRRDGAGRADRGLAPPERARRAVHPRARDLLIREPLPHRRGGTVVGPADGGATGPAAAVTVVPAREPRRAGDGPNCIGGSGARRRRPAGGRPGERKAARVRDRPRVSR